MIRGGVRTAPRPSLELSSPIRASGAWIWSAVAPPGWTTPARSVLSMVIPKYVVVRIDAKGRAAFSVTALRYRLVRRRIGFRPRSTTTGGRPGPPGFHGE